MAIAFKPIRTIIISTTREVSEKLGGYFSTFGGNPAACAIGLSVLEVGQGSWQIQP